MNNQNYLLTLEKIYSFIPLDPKKNFTFYSKVGLKRQQELLQVLGNPQNKLKVIHIAGTSGKGSTASFISSILLGHGFKVGLTVSPHLLDIRERVQINNKLISKEKFVKYFEQVEVAAAQMEKVSQYGKPTFFEVLIAIFFLASVGDQVDYAVIETGMGGLYDGTNSVDREDKIAVITKIGFDHMKFLGKTLSSIAGQKAGIINKHNVVFSIDQKPNVARVLKNRAQQINSQINFILPASNYVLKQMLGNGLTFDFKFHDYTLNDLSINTFANYQIENSALALSVCKYTADRDGWKMNENIIRKILANFEFPGRMSINKIKMANGIEKMLILDGAHNPQKMKAFVKSLNNIPGVEDFVFVIAFKKGKDYKKMLQYIIPIAKQIFVTQFELLRADNVQLAESAEVIVKNLIELDYSSYRIFHSPARAIEFALLNYPGCIVTGSLYLMSDVYTNALKSIKL